LLGEPAGFHGADRIGQPLSRVGFFYFGVGVAKMTRPFSRMTVNVFDATTWRVVARA